MMEDEDLKIILLGESGVGKTNLINITMGQEFNEEEASTGGSSFSQKKLKLGEKEYNVKLWDTIGQEKFRHLTKLFYSNSKIVIFVYDISVKSTFDALKEYWVKDINDKLGQNIIIGVVGNKIDKCLEEQVTQEEGEEYATSIGARFIMTSAKTEGPKKFEELLTQLLGDYLKKIGKHDPNELEEENSNTSKTFELKKHKKKSNEEKKKKKCC